MTAVRAVVLDVDGTLVDSNDAHAHAWVEAFAEQGIEAPFAKVRPLIGMGGDKLMPKAAGVDEGSPVGSNVSRRRREIFQSKHLPHLRPTPGAKELIRRMGMDGLRLAVASSAKKGELDALLKVCGADVWVEAKTSSDDAERSKPDPDIVQAALENLGLPEDAVVMLGDTPYDVEAATRAGIPIIALRCGGWDDRGLAGAAAIYDDPADLLARYDGSLLSGPKAAQPA